MKKILICLILLILYISEISAQGSQRVQISSKDIPDALYGTASYYANKFEGRLTANIPIAEATESNILKHAIQHNITA